MPMYEYRCDACGEVFEARQRITDDPLTSCKLCGAAGNVERLISSTSFVLKGSGWYKTDYAGGKKKGADATKPATDGAKSGDTAKPAGESKPSGDGGGKSEGGKKSESGGAGATA